VFELSALDGTNGFEIPGFGGTGASLNGVGDINNDGIDDFGIGSPRAGTNSNQFSPKPGRLDIIFGSATTFAPSFDQDTLDGSNGFTIDGKLNEHGDMGNSVAAGGDINGDGRDDLIFGARGGSSFENSGTAYILYGRDTPFPACFDPFSIDGNIGKVFIGEANFSGVGEAVLAADIDKDGFNELIIAARSLGNSDGRVYVVKGKAGSDIPTNIFASILPSARSGFFSGGPDISVFATVVNAGSIAAGNCTIETPDFSPASIRYFETDPATNAITGSENARFSLPINGSKSFVLFFTPTARQPFGAEVFPLIGCDNAFVERIPGVNSEFLTIGSEAGPDVLSIAATSTSDGIVHLSAADNAGFMAISALNNGVGDGSTADASQVSVTATIRGTFPALPLTILICETDAAGACKADPAATLDLAIGDVPAFIGVFAFGDGTAIPLDPAKTRISLDMRDAAGHTLSSTSVAVTTVAKR
jgi:hypothetical protein